MATEVLEILGYYYCQEKGHELYFRNGKKPPSNRTICQGNATWQGIENLVCWKGEFVSRDMTKF